MIGMLCALIAGFGSSVLPPNNAYDTDGDGVVGAADIQLVINDATGLPPTPQSDVSGDGVVDAVDIQMMINGVLNGAGTLQIAECPLYGAPDGFVAGTVDPVRADGNRILLYCQLRTEDFRDEYILMSPFPELTTVNDGAWAELLHSPELTATATGFVAYLVPPNAAVVSACLDAEPTIPGMLDKARQDRKPWVDYVVDPSIDGGVYAVTNCDPRFYGVISYVQYDWLDGNRIYPQPLSDPAGSDYLVPINTDGTFSHPLNQSSLGSVITDYNPAMAITVETQVLPLGTDYVDAWPEFTDWVLLNPQAVARVRATIVH